MLLLALVGVSATDIADDYALSARRLPARYAALGETDDGPIIEAFLSERDTTAEAILAGTLAALDIERRLRVAGLAAGDLAALRSRLALLSTATQGGVPRA